MCGRVDMWHDSLVRDLIYRFVIWIWTEFICGRVDMWHDSRVRGVIYRYVMWLRTLGTVCMCGRVDMIHSYDSLIWDMTRGYETCLVDVRRDFLRHDSRVTMLTPRTRRRGWCTMTICEWVRSLYRWVVFTYKSVMSTSEWITSTYAWDMLRESDKIDSTNPPPWAVCAIATYEWVMSPYRWVMFTYEWVVSASDESCLHMLLWCTLHKWYSHPPQPCAPTVDHQPTIRTQIQQACLLFSTNNFHPGA